MRTSGAGAPKVGVLIGRFQPCHNAHLAIIRHALERNDLVLLGIGSARQARSPKNPFTVEERVGMLANAIGGLDRVSFMPLRDYLYNDNQWIVDVQRKVREHCEERLGSEVEPKITIVGRMKDRSSYYLRLFPQWACDDYPNVHAFDATQVRTALFDGWLDEVARFVPLPVFTHLKEWMSSPTFPWLLEEHRHYELYKSMWKVPEKVPFPPTFVTTDAVVIQSGHVLLVRRRSAPGRGLYALPGGFLAQLESIVDGILRELKEETGLRVPKDVLRAAIIDQRVFDHPDRSLRGRTITHAACIDLGDGPLAEVKGADDADKAFWMPLADLYSLEDQFFEDHAHIIRHFVSRF